MTANTVPQYEVTRPDWSHLTFTWEVTGLKTRDIENKPSSVVQTYWKKTGTDGNGNTGIFIGATPFTVDPTDDSGPFIPFEQLTEQDVLDWIKTVVVGDYEDHVNGQIQKQIDEKASPVIEVSLPWAQSANT
jgi:hypothetical protein